MRRAFPIIVAEAPRLPINLQHVYSQVEAALSLRQQGLGCQVKANAWYATEILPGTAAEKTGVRPGDLLRFVPGKPNPGGAS